MPEPRVRFGLFDLCPATRELRREGEPLCQAPVSQAQTESPKRKPSLPWKVAAATAPAAVISATSVSVTRPGASHPPGNESSPTRAKCFNKQALKASSISHSQRGPAHANIGRRTYATFPFTPHRSETCPTQPPELALEMVSVSHGNIKRLRELVTARPSLAKASWDWGFGDWETALGAVSHVGNRDIALYLIEQGRHARPLGCGEPQINAFLCASA